jgi:hypothetical protein
MLGYITQIQCQFSKQRKPIFFFLGEAFKQRTINIQEACMIMRKVKWLGYILVLASMIYGAAQLDFLGSSATLKVQAFGCCQYTSECGDVDQYMCKPDDGETCSADKKGRCQSRPKKDEFDIFD